MNEDRVGLIPTANGADRGEQRKPYKHTANGTRQWWSDRTKVDTVKAFLVTGSLTDASRITGVAYNTIRHWHISDWWKEIEDNLRSEENIELSARLKKRIDKALEVTLDRLENGDFQYDPKTGSFIRRPVAFKDANKALIEMVKTRKEVDSIPVEAQNKQAVLDTLTKLTEEFAKMARGKRPTRVIDVEVKDASEPSTQGTAPQLPSGV